LRAILAALLRVGAGGLHLVRRALFEQQDVWVVRGAFEGFSCDPVCARCLSPATRNRVELSPSGTKTIPYCQECLDRFGERNVAQLGWILGCVLVGVAGCVFFPLLPWLSMRAALVGALAFASAPWVVGQLWLSRADLALRTRRAAYAGADGLVCTNKTWALRLGARLGCDVVHRRVRGRITSGWSVTGLVIATVLTPGLYDTFHCAVRILNLTEEDLIISIDGRALAVTKPSSQEHPRAGSKVRIAMGSRRLEARSHDGALIHSNVVHVAAGHEYLYAPAHPANTCFWIEQTAHGRLQGADLPRDYLPAGSDFWQMPVAIDTWFTPALGSESEFFTGGVVTSLRQGSCQPAAIRP
jgi:hypothetical protein